MDKLRDAVSGLINRNLYRIIISKPLQKEELTKVVIRPVKIKEKVRYQESRYVGTKVLHENYDAHEMTEGIISYMDGAFGQLEAECANQRITILCNKKGTVTIKKKNTKENAVASQNLNHDRTKKYLLEDGVPVDFLVALGVQMPDGKVAKARYDKFKQINRYLEFIEDILPTLSEEDTIRIIDFGCGKSYLTFALYYYLHLKKKWNVEIVGLDLKQDVIDTCNRLKDRLGYEGLRFLQGDIRDYENTDQVDMVVSLHACDTATDYVIAKAVSWDAKVIMAVPCCQHEMNRQIHCQELQPVLKYGIIKERMSALLTDAYRADCLELLGYDTQILEFIDMEHTPKNILIRAVRKNQKAMSANAGKEQALFQMKELLNVDPLLGHLIEEMKEQ